MATVEANAVSAPPSAQVVGHAFVEQYYHILHHSPDLVHRFYQDPSALSRPDANGSMTTVKTMQAINEKILSLNFEEYTAEIKTADSQDSYGNGVIVLVTGCLTGKDDVKKKFTQTFFLAPQDKGFYVLNDVFRFVDENEAPNANTVPVTSVIEVAQEISPATTEPEPTHGPDHLVVDRSASFKEGEEDLINGPEVFDPSDDEEGSTIEEEVVVEPPIESSENAITSSVDVTPEIVKDAPRISYASILKVKASTTPTPSHVPNRAVKQALPTNTDQQSVNFVKPAPTVEAPPVPSDNIVLENDSPREGEGHSIYVRNLPYDATVEQLEEEFKKFGPIKREGVQVRSSKQQGFCFGFVEFESMSSMQSALEASPITIGDRQAVVEEKRTSTRVGSGSSGSGGRGKYSSGRGGSFRSDSFRGRSNFNSGGRNYGRSEFRSQGGDYASRGRGSPSGRGGGDGYQRQNGRGGARQGGATNRTTVAT